MPLKCKDCPHNNGTSYYRDCCFPDCVGGWEKVANELKKDLVKCEIQLNRYHLYVWPEFCTDYTSGLAFAIAESEKEAKDMIMKENVLPKKVGSNRDFYFNENNYVWGKVTVLPLYKPVSYYVWGGS